MLRFVPALAALYFMLAACSPPEPTSAAPQSTPAEVEEGPGAYRGSAVAGQVCVQCHDIGNGTTPTMNIGAPGFRDVAGRPSSTVEGLVAWMQASHPKMPNYLFSGQEVADLAEYIMSLAAPAR